MTSAFNQDPFQTNQDKHAFDMMSFVHRVISKWWLFAISIVVFLGIAFLLMRYLTPHYVIRAKILVEDQHKGGGSISQAAVLRDMSNLLDHRSNVDNEAEILKTRNLAENVVKRLDLHVSYYRSGTFKSIPFYKTPFKVKIVSPADSIRTTTFMLAERHKKGGVLRYKEYLSKEPVSLPFTYNHPFVIKEIGVVELSPNPPYHFEEGYGYKFKITTVDDAVTALQKDLTISVTNKLVSTIDLTLKHPLALKGEEILKTLLEEYVNKNVNEKNQIADSTVAFIENRLMLVSKELGDIEGDIQKFKQTNSLADISEQSKLLLSNSSQYVKELSDVKTQLSIIDALEEYLQDASNKKVVPHSILANNSGFNDLVENYNKFLQDRSRQLLTSTEDNPYIKNLDERIGELRKAMLSNLLNTKKSLEIQRNQLQNDINALSNEIRNVPAHERAYLGLFRQQTLKQELYLFLLKKREETALSKTTNISPSKIIDPAKSEVKPSSPNKIVILAVSLLLGLLIPLGFVYVLELKDDAVRSRSDVSKKVDLPIIGELAHVSASERRILAKQKSMLAEQFRSIRTSLLEVAKKETIMVASGGEGEGKTFTAINLASILALADKKILIVDGDLRSGKLSNELKMSGKKGLADYAFSSETTMESLVYASGIHDNIHIVPSGTLMQGASELLLKSNIGEVLSTFKTNYDYVLVVAPPVQLVSDAFLLSKFCDRTFYIIRANLTSKHHLEHLQELVKGNKLAPISLLINDTRGKKRVYGV